MMYITYELVVEMLQLHDFRCVFELDAPMKIFTRLMAAEFHTTECLHLGIRVAEFKECFTLSEIYCPHEGIDRRSDYGIG